MTLHWPLQMIWTNDVFNWEFNEQNRCSYAPPAHNYVLLLLLPDNSTDFEEVTVRTQLKKKKAEQQAHENFAAENKEDLYHGASKSRRKSRQVTMVSVETASQKGAPDH